MSRKGVIIAIGLVGVTAGVALAWRPWEGAGSDEPLRFETVTVDKGRIAAKVTATGTLSPRNTVQVGAQVSGRIAEIDADFNSRVTKGQVIARLDTSVLEAQKAQAKASLAVAEANRMQASSDLRQAEITYRRQKQMRAENLNSQADLDLALASLTSARAAVAARRAQVEQAQASIQQTELNIGYATIVSPVDGVVLSRAVDVGQTVAASLQAPTLFTIAEDLARMQIDTSVAESDVGKVTADLKATFAVDAFPGRTFEGKVRQVRNAATTVSGVVTYNAVIDVDNPDLALRPGMTANVTLVVAEMTDAVRIPNAALRFRPAPEVRQAMIRQAFGGTGKGGGTGPGGNGTGMRGGGTGPGGGGGGTWSGGPGGGREGGGSGEPVDPNARTVWKVVDGKAKPVHIVVGLTDGTTTALTSGELAAGDVLVTDVLNPPKADKPARLF
ncbi:MAG: efflux RND transporter periplasmic adaptor subunit [Myxococcota bacterium]